GGWRQRAREPLPAQGRPVLSGSGGQYQDVRLPVPSMVLRPQRIAPGPSVPARRERSGPLLSRVRFREGWSRSLAGNDPRWCDFCLIFVRNAAVRGVPRRVEPRILRSRLRRSPPARTRQDEAARRDELEDAGRELQGPVPRDAPARLLRN